MEKITDFLEALRLLIKPNPEAQRLRLENKEYRISARQKRREERQCNHAEKEVKRLQKDLAKDADGYTKEDKALIDQLNKEIQEKRVELIRAKIT